MKVSALCTFVHLQRPLLYAGRAAQSVGDPTAAIVDSSPFRPFALPSRVCLCLRVYFLFICHPASVRPPHSDNRFHWSINSRRSLCLPEKFLFAATTALELRKGNSSVGERNLSQAIVDLDLAHGNEKNRSRQWQAREKKSSQASLRSVYCISSFLKVARRSLADLPLHLAMRRRLRFFINLTVIADQLSPLPHQLPLNNPIRTVFNSHFKPNKHFYLKRWFLVNLKYFTVITYFKSCILRH